MALLKSMIDREIRVTGMLRICGKVAHGLSVFLKQRTRRRYSEAIRLAQDSCLHLLEYMDIIT
jgi:hypothetical protein